MILGEVFEHLGFSWSVFTKKHPEDRNRNRLVGNRNKHDQTRDYNIISLQEKHGGKCNTLLCFIFQGWIGPNENVCLQIKDVKPIWWI